MHFSQEAFKTSQFVFKDDLTPLGEIAGCSTGTDTMFCQTEDFLAFNELVDFQDNSSEKPISYFFPNADQIDTKLNDGPSLINSVDNTLPKTSKQFIESILEQINKLSPVEKLMLYLKLPTGKDVQDPLKLPINPLGSRTEITQTISWIKTHLREDKDTSIPKQDVYTEYLEFCGENKMKPLSTADFGKVMKQVYPSVRPRRLGTRGNSRYCYSGMTCRTELPLPALPRINVEEGERTCAWAAQVLGTPISSLSELEAHLASRGLPTSSRSLSAPPPLGSDAAYCMSSKISKTLERRPSETDHKRKIEEDSNSGSKSPPERCKGKIKRSNPKKLEILSGESSSSTSTSKSRSSLVEEVKRSKSASSLMKLPIPRLNSGARCLPPKPDPSSLTKRSPKPLQPKPEQQGYLDNGNLMEQEEELMRYFEAGREESPKSQLRQLLEKKEGKGQVRRRVSFENVPEGSKKFNFAPISPVSPFLQPKRILHRSMSVCGGKASQHKSPALAADNSPTRQPSPAASSSSSTGAGAAAGGGSSSRHPSQREVLRSQSVPMLLLQDTPVPSEIIDFGLEADTSASAATGDLLSLDEASNSLLINSGAINSDNLSAIFSIIHEMESQSNTPTQGFSQTNSAHLTENCTSSLFDDIDCSVSLSGLASDVTQLDSDIL